MTDLLAAIVNEPNVVIIRKKKKTGNNANPKNGSMVKHRAVL